MINFTYEYYTEENTEIIEIPRKGILNPFTWIMNDWICSSDERNAIYAPFLNWRDYFEYNELLKGINTVHTNGYNIHETVTVLVK